jgi:hypothetical protein
MDQFVDAAYVGEMPEPLFAALLSSNAFLQNSCRQSNANFPSVLEAVRDSLRRAVDSDGNTFDLSVDDTLREGLAGESHEAHFQAIDDRLFRFVVDSHPNLVRIAWKNAVQGERRLKAYDTTGHSQAREDDLMLEVRGKAFATVETAADLDEQSIAYSFAQVVGMNAVEVQVFCTSDRSSFNQRNQPFDGKSCSWQIAASKNASVVVEALRLIVP